MDIDELFQQIVFEQQLAKKYGLDLTLTTTNKENEQQTISTEESNDD